MILVATVPFLGKQYQVFLRPNSCYKIKFDGTRFLVNQKIGTDFEKLKVEFDLYCKNKLTNIINSGISNLRKKTIEVELMYTDGVKNFPKKIRTSVDKYLKEIGYSTKIDYKIGKFEKEWGINEINPKNKRFVLYFNQDLIKYDNGPHIEYVVAHELVHIFHRDHGDGFHSTLQKLFPKKRSSEEFFKSGINKRFRMPGLAGASNFNWILIVVIVLILIYFLLQISGTFLADLINPASQVQF